MNSSDAHVIDDGQADGIPIDLDPDTELYSARELDDAALAAVRKAKQEWESAADGEGRLFSQTELDLVVRREKRKMRRQAAKREQQLIREIAVLTAEALGARKNP